MNKICRWENFLKYAKNPVTPSSCGILAITKGVFAPFIYVPLSSFSGRLLKESIESISLFNRGIGIVIILLSLIGFGLLIKKKYLSSLVPAVISVVIITIEVYRVAVEGVHTNMKTSVYDPTIFFGGPLVSYDVAVRGRFGTALGYLVGGHISFFFSVVMGRNQMRKKEVSSHIIKKPRLRIFLGIVLLLVVISVLLHFFMIAGGKPIVEANLEGFLNWR